MHPIVSTDSPASSMASTAVGFPIDATHLAAVVPTVATAAPTGELRDATVRVKSKTKYKQILIATEGNIRRVSRG